MLDIPKGNRVPHSARCPAAARGQPDRRVRALAQHPCARSPTSISSCSPPSPTRRSSRSRTCVCSRKSRTRAGNSRSRTNTSRTFFASASHDLRQPLHALNLFVAQLRGETNPAERERIVERIDAATASMNELFGALLDMSKLDAGILEPNLTEFPLDRLLKRIETTFAGAARAKGLRLQVLPSSGWARSDFILLERILQNLVSNAVRYTERGGVLVGCRRRGGQLRIDVYDSGPGIRGGPASQHLPGVLSACDRRAGPPRWARSWPCDRRPARASPGSSCRVEFPAGTWLALFRFAAVGRSAT